MPVADRSGAPHVLMVAPTPFFADRGCHVRIYEQARALQALGCHVEVCTYHLGSDPPGLIVHRTRRVPWYKKLAAGPSWHKIYIDGLLLLKVWAVARRTRPDVIHGHLHEGAAIGWATGRLLGIPVLGDFQGSLTGELKAHRFVRHQRLAYRLLAGAERWIDHRPQVAVASCTDVARELSERFNVPGVVLALDGVDTGTFRPDVAVADDVRGLVPPGRRAVVYLGVLEAYQGVDHLLAAIPHVLSCVPQAHFLVMGYPNEDRYRARAADMGLAEHVTFPGRIDYRRAAEYLALGEVAAGPKLSETESNGKLYNYMACGLPTVAFDTPPSREILGELGVYAPRGDAAALGGAIAGLLADPEGSRQLGARLRQRAIECFSWESTARRLIEAYTTAISRRADPDRQTTR